MDAQLRDYLGRHKRLDSSDGTGEIAFGLMALGFASMDFVQTVLPKDSIWRHGLPNMALFLGMLFLMVGVMGWVNKVIKKHVTWPRTGYVVYRTRRNWVVLVLTAIVSAIIAVGLGYLTRSAHPGHTEPAAIPNAGRNWISITGMWTAAMYVGAYAWFTYLWGRNHRWKWLVLVFMVLGLVLIALFAPVDFAALPRPMFLFVGLLWIASGAGTLYSYVRHTQLPEQPQE